MVRGGVKLIQFGCEHKVTSRKRHVDHIRRKCYWCRDYSTECAVRSG